MVGISVVLRAQTAGITVAHVEMPILESKSSEQNAVDLRSEYY